MSPWKKIHHAAASPRAYMDVASPSCDELESRGGGMLLPCPLKEEYESYSFRLLSPVLQHLSRH